MNVLSLFDGMSCGQIALNRAGFKIDKYFASEIDKHAISVTMKNFPDTVQLGDVCKVKAADLPKIDLIIGGSPCQGFSLAGKQLNFDDPRSVLFFEFVRLLKEVREINPNVWFLLENVRMKKEYQDRISDIMGCNLYIINSARVSAQNRVRLYWTNIPVVGEPKDKGIVLRDILEDEVPEKYFLSDKMIKGLSKPFPGYEGRFIPLDKKSEKSQTLKSNYHKMSRTDPYIKVLSNLYENNPQEDNLVLLTKRQKINHKNENEKANCFLSSSWKGSQANGMTLIGTTRIRRLTPIECERLQTVPDDYTAGVSDTQRYRMLGNGWTVDVIAWILSFINPETVRAAKQTESQTTLLDMMMED